MFNLGFTHLLILGVIALVVIGPEQLPEMARKFAKLLNELRRAKDEIMAPMNEFHAEAQRMINDTQQKVNQDISKLVEMRDKLDAEIRAHGSDNNTQAATTSVATGNSATANNAAIAVNSVTPPSTPKPEPTPTATPPPDPKGRDGQ